MVLLKDDILALSTKRAKKSLQQELDGLKSTRHKSPEVHEGADGNVRLLGDEDTPFTFDDAPLWVEFASISTKRGNFKDLVKVVQQAKAL